jgi:hypothetical protein
MPSSANLINLIREVGYDMGFIEIDKSKITFIDRSP